MVAAIFLRSFSRDFQSMGMGISMRYISVETLEAKEDQMMGLDMAAWQTSASGIVRERLIGRGRKA